VNISKAGAL